VIGVQALHEPVYWNGAGNFEYLVDQNTQWQASTAYVLKDVVIPTTRNGFYYECTTAGTSAGSQPTWPTTVGSTVVDGTATWTCREIQKSNVSLSAFGRLFLVSPDGTTIYYSDLLIPFDFSGGSSGSIDLDTVWPTSNDTVVALAVHNNNLVILCEKSVVIYSGADTLGESPTSFALVETITNVGCAARDSVQNIGDDLLWLSSEGVRTLSRTILQNNMPLATASSQVRTELIAVIDQELDSDVIRSAYNEKEGLYLVNFPTVGQVYVFDVRLISQGQTIRPFIWDSINPYGLATRRNGDLIFGFAGGFLGKYNTYLDNASTYIMKFRSGWIDPGSQGKEMIWKAMRVYLNASFDFTSTGAWAYDFEIGEATETKAIEGSNVSEWNIAEYGIGEYGSGDADAELEFDLTGTGELIKVGFQAEINAGKVGINKITLKAKTGKLN
jgi:hypothetical protein